MAGLHDALALESVRIETETFQAKLKSRGALDVVRSVRISAALAPAGAPPPKRGKRIHFVRHGQGFHNLLADLYREMGKKFDSESGEGGADNPYCHPAVVDPPLTAIGRQQAAAAQGVAQAAAVELVVVSPLQRATQTALIAFQHLVEGSSTTVPFVAHEGCREISGVHVCDRRRSVSELQKDFPMIDYAAAGVPDEDSYWHASEREKLVDLAARGYDFLLWVRDRPEKEIAVASHFAWLMTLFNAVLRCNEKHLSYGFQTGEVRSMDVVFEEEEPDASCEKSEEPPAKRLRN